MKRQGKEYFYIFIFYILYRGGPGADSPRGEIRCAAVLGEGDGRREDTERPVQGRRIPGLGRIPRARFFMAGTGQN